MTTQPPARPKVGSVGSGNALPNDAEPPAGPLAGPPVAPYRRPRMQDAANLFTEEEFGAMDRAREAVRSGAFTAEDAARYRPVNPAPLSADWWRADAAGGLRTVGEAIFAIGAGHLTNEQQVRAVTDYYDAHPEYLKAIPDYVRHQMAQFLKGHGYARIPMNAPHPQQSAEDHAKELAEDADYQAFLSALPPDRDKSRDERMGFGMDAADALWKWWNLQEALKMHGQPYSPFPPVYGDRGRLAALAVAPFLNR